MRTIEEIVRAKARASFTRYLQEQFSGPYKALAEIFLVSEAVEIEQELSAIQKRIFNAGVANAEQNAIDQFVENVQRITL